ncbi:hypothetical protein BDD12DRAFT_846774 [Trichophaea hybrida]|nr:hypothetical protein BDD12DRAFT_846774 [Trichophaea hybrida]
MGFSCYLAAIQCAMYHTILRPGWIWECTEGCMTNMDSDYAKVANRIADFMQMTGRPYSSMSFKRPFRLCLRCIHETDNPPEHLFRLIRTIMRVVLRCTTMVCETNKFGREIGFLEDYRAGKTLASVASVFAHEHFEFGPESNSRMTKKATEALLKQIPGLWPRGLFPGSNTHATLMFGPLIIENGATRRSPGFT